MCYYWWVRTPLTLHRLKAFIYITKLKITFSFNKAWLYIFLLSCRSIVFLPFNCSFVPPQHNTCSLHHSNRNEYWHSVFTHPPSWKKLGRPFVPVAFSNERRRIDVVALLGNQKIERRWVLIRINSFVTFLWWILHEGFYANGANPAVSIICVRLTHQRILTRLCFNSTDRWVADWKHDRQPSVTLCEI